MSADQLRHRVATPKVIHETLDQETVVVNLDSGVYYSLDPTGCAIWQALASGATLEEATVWLGKQFKGDLEVMREECARILRESIAEGLMVVSSEPPTPLPVIDIEPQAPFSVPCLSRYTDIQDLLLLDPVHEVDLSAGWPIAKPTL